MGYHHYWTRPQQFPAEPFAEWSADVARIIANTDVPLAGIDITPTLVCFNGDRESFTKPEDYIRYFVSRGVAQDTAAYYAQIYSGTGAQEGFYMAQDAEGGLRDAEPPDETMIWYHDLCKTQQKPYDEVVTAALALLAHRFPRLCYVRSDGNAKNWRDGLDLVERSLGLRLNVPSYHHWWRCAQSNDAKAFAAWRDDMIWVIAASSALIGGPDGTGQPIISPSMVSLNGVGDDACDPFTVELESAPYFRSCRTAQRPYDIVITAAIILLTYHYRHLVSSLRLPGGKPIYTDGEPTDWQPGLMLARQVTGRDLVIPWLE